MNLQSAISLGGRAAALAASPLCVCLCTFLFDHNENPISLKTLLGNYTRYFGKFWTKSITLDILENFEKKIDYTRYFGKFWKNSITLNILENFEKIDYTKYFEKFEEKMITLYIFENFD